MITQVLTATKVGKVFHYTKRDHEKEVTELPKSDEFVIVRKFNTEEVTRQIGDRTYKVQKKIYPFFEEKVYKDGKEIEFDFRKKGLNVETKILSKFNSPATGLWKTYESLPDEYKEFYDEGDFEYNNLIVVSYLASSGSISILDPIPIFIDDVLNFTIPVKVPPIGTCDMKSHKVCILITKDIFEVKECDGYVVRFIEED